MSFAWLLAFPSSHRVRFSFVQTDEGEYVQSTNLTAKLYGRGRTTHRRELCLSNPAWLKRRRADISEDLDVGVSLVGLVELARGQILESSVTDLSPEEKLFWDYCIWPLDFYSCRITRVWKLVRPLPVCSVTEARSERTSRRVANDDFYVCPIQVSPGMVAPCLPNLAYMVCSEVGGAGGVGALSGSIRLSDLEQTLGIDLKSVRGVLVPEVIAKLALANAWVYISLLGRWGPSPLGQWPAEEWRLSTCYKHTRINRLWNPDMEPSLLLPGTFSQVASVVRELASSESMSEHGSGSLCRLVEWMDDCEASLTMASPAVADSWQMDKTAGRVQFKAQALLAAFQASQNMFDKSREAAQATLVNCVQATMPPAVQGIVLNILEGARFPGKETVREAGLSVDAAFLLHQRRHVKYTGGATYLWMDSTAHGHDWLLSQINRISYADLVQALSWCTKAWLLREEADCDDAVAACQHLRKLIDQHMLVPVALGLRYSKLAHKVSGLMHGVLLESESLFAANECLGVGGLCDNGFGD